MAKFYIRVLTIYGSKDITQIDRALNEIAEFNIHHSASATNLFVAFLRFKSGLSPSAKAAELYIALLQEETWRNLRAAKLATPGGWPNPSFEMYLHFVKLAACGATDAQITQVYKVLTTVDPVLDANAFPSITPESWRNFGGWRSSGLLDITDLGAENLTASKEVIEVGLGNASVITKRLPLQFILDNGYYKDRPVSCFRGDTQVVLADGKSTKRIDQIFDGEEVLSYRSAQDGSSKPVARTVAFVSKTPRCGRPLYSINDLDIWFTDTHPIVCTPETLSFVDPLLASSLNPSWHSLCTAALPGHSLRRNPPTGSIKIEDPDEVLYDLVFDHGNDDFDVLGPASYFLCSQHSSSRLHVASEAPVAAWFPLSTVFLQNAIHAMVSASRPAAMNELALENEPNVGVVLRYLQASGPNTGNNGSLNLLYSQVGQALRFTDKFDVLCSRLSQNKTDKKNVSEDVKLCHPVSVAEILPLSHSGSSEISTSSRLGESSPVFPSSDSDLHHSARLIEYIVASIGRTLEDELCIGWAYLDPKTIPALPTLPVSRGTSDSGPLNIGKSASFDKPLLFIHSLRFPMNLGTVTEVMVEARLPTSHLVLGKIRASITREGTRTLQVRRAIDLSDTASSGSSRKAGGDAFDGPARTMNITITLLHEGRSLETYSGRTTFTLGVPAIVLVNKIKNDSAAGSQKDDIQIVILNCKYDLVPRQAVVREKAWNENLGEWGKEYATLMGRSFGQTLIDKCKV